MKTKILLIQAPTTAIGERISIQEISTDVLNLATVWRDAGFAVDLLDARSAGLNVFEIAYEIRRRAPHYVWIARTRQMEMNGIVTLLTSLLKLVLPRLQILKEGKLLNHSN